MTEYLSQEQQLALANTKSTFVDYTHFEDDAKRRDKQKMSFQDGEIYNIAFNYPKLDTLNDGDSGISSLAQTKTRVSEAIFELDANMGSNELSEAEYSLYASFLQNRLQKILLVEASRRMQTAQNSGQQQLAREEFNTMNETVFGDVDREEFLGMIHTELEGIQSFEPQDEKGQSIKAYLLESLNTLPVENFHEKPLISDEKLVELHECILKRYETILSAVPDTDDDVKYDARQCVEIMNEAFKLGGLADKGWCAEIHQAKTAPSTNSDAKKIYLPPNTLRTAAELRRLILHEEEVHARSAQNGAETGVTMLAKGTAEYADVQEGLGVLMECLVAGSLQNKSFDRARDRYIAAGLGLGVDSAPRDSRTTYDTLWRIIAIRNAKDGQISEKIEADARALAMSHVENAFRGTDGYGQGVIYRKLKVYWEGFVKAADYLASADDVNAALDLALCAKYNFTDPVETANVMEIIKQRQVVA